MSEAYFGNFSLVNYKGVITKNIVNRSRFIQSVLQNYYSYYDYVVSDHDTWEIIAYKYYGSADLDWLCYFSNNVFDPYYEFPLRQEAFDNYMVQKYGSWETAQTTIDHYTYNSVDSGGYVDPNLSYTGDYNMTPTTYSFLTPTQKSYWRPVTVYDAEFAKNEAKRTIKLIDRRLKDQVLKEISEIMQ